MKLPIFTFHKVGEVRSKYWISKEALFAQLQTLHSLGYSPRTMAEIYRGEYGEKPCVLTFDDAYQNFLTDAVPVLERFDFKATVFVPTAFIGSDNRGWENYDIVPVPHLAEAEIKALSTDGYDFQPHTHFHRNFLRIDAVEQWKELTDAKTFLEAIIQKRTMVHCYPGGGYNQSIMELVEKAGYEMAVSCDPGVEDTETMNKFALRRLHCYSELV